MMHDETDGCEIAPEALAVARQVEGRFPITGSDHGLDAIRAWAAASGYRTDEAGTLREWERLNTPGAVFVDAYGAWEIGCGPKDGRATFIDRAGVTTWIPEGADDYPHRPALIIHFNRQEQAA